MLRNSLLLHTRRKNLGIFFNQRATIIGQHPKEAHKPEYDPPTPAEVKYRMKRAQYDDWHENVWLKHLDQFYARKPPPKETYVTETVAESKWAISKREWIEHLHFRRDYARKHLELILLSLEAHELSLPAKMWRKIFGNK